MQSAARFLIRHFVLALLVAVGVVSQASATTVTATYKGTVNTAFDASGVFGTPATNLAGADYKLVFTIDSAAGSYSTYNGTITDPLLSGDQIFGGISAALTINGHSYAFTGTGSPSGNFDLFGSKPGFGFVAQQFSVFSSSAGSQVRAGLSSTNPGPGFPTSVYTSFLLTSCPSASCSAYLSFDVPGGPSGYFHGTLNFGSLAVTTLGVTTTPIPGTLPLLVSALGGLGFVGWRRRWAKA